LRFAEIKILVPDQISCCAAGDFGLDDMMGDAPGQVVDFSSL
jgi:hypothetical protein